MSSTSVYEKENKKMKMRIKICVDIAMTIALLLLMAYQLVGEEAHEWIGIHESSSWIPREYDFSEPMVFFLLDYLAVMGMFVFVGYYLSKNMDRKI